MRRRVLAAFATAAAVAIAVPAVAEAHGLVQRQQLPIPQWLFAWAAAAVLVVSFGALAVLWPEPRLEKASWRPLPGGRFPFPLPLGRVGGRLRVIPNRQGRRSPSGLLSIIDTRTGGGTDD